MKSLAEYATPISDKAVGTDNYQGLGGCVSVQVSRELEQKLAACRQQLKEVNLGLKYHMKPELIAENVIKTLELTRPN